MAIQQLCNKNSNNSLQELLDDCLVNSPGDSSRDVDSLFRPGKKETINFSSACSRSFNSTLISLLFSNMLLCGKNTSCPK